MRIVMLGASASLASAALVGHLPGAGAMSVGISCRHVIDGSVRVAARKEGEIEATFRPRWGLSLKQAAHLCGFETFDWVQEVTKQENPSPFYARNINGAFDPKVKGPVRLTSARAPWSDPPQGGGYTYTKDPDFSYPFFYDVKTELPDHQRDKVMYFSDEPTDPCMIGGDEAGTPDCNNTSQPRGSYGSYVTHLAGVDKDGRATKLGIGFTWNSDYNGTTGRVTITSVTCDTAYR